jgi:CCR4-NOT transcription complex subunit 7/8
MSETKPVEEEKSPLSSDTRDPINISSSLESSSGLKENYPNIKNPADNSGIIEVYRDNFIDEMKNLMSLLNKYNYIGMDTEYPGIVYQVENNLDEFYYKSVKLNVESLKLIQLGITLSDSRGRFPYPYHTWQFNFEFDPEKDKNSDSSINLLRNSGINFDELKKNGIEHKLFFEVFKTSGLVLNPKINWISFHGSYDFAYLLFNLLESPLPQRESEFTKLLGLYFPNHYDIKILVKEKSKLRGSLNKLAQYLYVEREGKIHQAGSDSYVTIDVFWKLISFRYISKEELKEKKNILFGISKGKDDEETSNYIKTNHNGKVIMKNDNGNNNYNNMENLINNNYYYDIKNMLYMPINRNIYNPGMNYFYPQMILNQMNNGFNRVLRMNNNFNNFPIFDSN